jgi:CubicO group peptidase (beta-lactamase class C family)
MLLGKLIESVSGRPYAQYVAQQLIEPLRLGDSETLAFAIAKPLIHARGTPKRFGWLNAVLGFVTDRDRLVDAATGRWVQFRNHRVNGDAYGAGALNATLLRS